jgi:fatty-acyl-CoA synthase
MKFGFSTLGCPGWLWTEIITAARDLGYDGIEMRGLGSEMYLPHSKTFAPAHIPNVLENLNKLHLEIPCLTTGAYLFDPAHKEQAAREILDYLDLAALLKTPYIRILGDMNPEPGTVDQALVEEHIRRLLPVAAQKNVALLLESNGIYADSQLLGKLMQTINDPHLGVLWDVHHPYRFYHEPIAETYAALKPWIKHVHIKDSVFEQGQTAYRMFGQGNIPVREILHLLQSRQYPGYVVLEWVKRWCKELEEPGIVFAHFLNAAKNML